MRSYVDQVVPATTRKVLVTHTCDLCGASLLETKFEIKEATIRVKVGESYPEGGQATELEMDVCVVCVETKVFPFLNGLGAVIHKKETDW